MGTPEGQTYKYWPKLTPNMGIMQMTWYYANDIQDKAWRYFFIIFLSNTIKKLLFHIKTKRSLASKFGAIYPKYQWYANLPSDYHQKNILIYESVNFLSGRIWNFCYKQHPWPSKGGLIIYLGGFWRFSEVRLRGEVIGISHGNRGRDTRVALIKCTFETQIMCLEAQLWSN